MNLASVKLISKKTAHITAQEVPEQTPMKQVPERSYEGTSSEDSFEFFDEDPHVGTVNNNSQEDVPDGGSDYLANDEPDEPISAY